MNVCMMYTHLWPKEYGRCMPAMKILLLLSLLKKNMKVSFMEFKAALGSFEETEKCQPKSMTTSGEPVRNQAGLGVSVSIRSERGATPCLSVFLVRCALFVEYYTPVRKCTAAPMFMSCSTADRSRWCAQLARNQCHRDIEEWVSPLQVRFI